MRTSPLILLTILLLALNISLMPSQAEDDPNPDVNHHEIGVLPNSISENGYPQYLHIKSRFYGYDSAVDNNVTSENLAAYNYTPHLIYDKYHHKYRLITGGRYRDYDTGDGDGTIVHDGDHSLPFVADPVNPGRSADLFRGALNFTSNSISRFNGMFNSPGPSYVWADEVSSTIPGGFHKNPEKWWVGNTLEPEFIRFFDQYILVDQTMILEGHKLDQWNPGKEYAEAKADRLQIHTSPLSSPSDFQRVYVDNPGYSNHRGIVINIPEPHLTKLTHHMLLVVPDDSESEMFWLYTAWFYDNAYQGYVRLKSDNMDTFDWNEKMPVNGFSGLGNQLGYCDLSNGKRLFISMGTANLVDGRTVPSINVSPDGLNFDIIQSHSIISSNHAATTQNRVALAAPSTNNNPNNLNCFFLGMATIDGWGRIESLGNDVFRTYYLATTSNTPTAPDIFQAEIGLGEMIFQFNASSLGFDWSGVMTDVDGDGVYNLGDYDSDNDGAPDDWELFLSRNPHDLNDAGYSFAYDDDSEGWTSTNVSNLSVSSGNIDGQNVTNPRLFSPQLGFQGSDLPVVHIRMKASVIAWSQLNWLTDTETTYSGTRSSNVALPSQTVNEFTWHYHDLRSNSNYTGTQITELRITPFLAANHSFEIDEIKLSDGDRDDDGLDDVQDGYADVDNDGLVGFLDSDSDNDGALDGWENQNGRQHDDASDGGISFSSSGSLNGWSLHKLADVVFGAEALKATTEAAAASIESPNLGFDGSNFKRVHMRIKSSAVAFTQLQWRTPTESQYHSSRTISIGLPGAVTTGSTWVSFNTEASASWTSSIIEKLQIKPCLITGASIEVYDILFSDGDRDDDGIPDDVEGYGDSNTDGTPDFLDPNS